MIALLALFVKQQPNRRQEPVAVNLQLFKAVYSYALVITERVSRKRKTVIPSFRAGSFQG